MMLWKTRAFSRKNHGVFRGEYWRNGDFLVEGLRTGQAKSDTKPMTQPTCGSVFLRSARTWKKSTLKFEPRIDDGRKQSDMICDAHKLFHQKIPRRVPKKNAAETLLCSDGKSPVLLAKSTLALMQHHLLVFKTRFWSVRSPIFQMSINWFSIFFARCFQLCEHVFQDFPVFPIVFLFLPRVFRVFQRAFPDFPTPRASTRSSAPHFAPVTKATTWPSTTQSVSSKMGL